MKKATGLAAAFVAAAITLGATAASAEAVKPEAVKFNDLEVKQSLTGTAGDAAAGKKWFADRKLGNCLACHVNKDLSSMPFHGEIGPPMDGAADRYSPEQMRAILIDSKKVLGEETIMPSFYKTETGARPLDKFKGKTILEGQQIEDIIAYLQTLKE